MEGMKTFLTHKLKLTVNETKSAVDRTSNIDFLGFVFSGTRIIWCDKAYREFRRRVKQYTGRSWRVSMKYRLFKLAQYLRGWMGYFGISEYYREIPEIDGWIRRRIRLCYWKQWRWCRGRKTPGYPIGISVDYSIFKGLPRFCSTTSTGDVIGSHRFTYEGNLPCNKDCSPDSRSVDSNHSPDYSRPVLVVSKEWSR